MPKPMEDNDLQDENEAALHPIHLALGFQKMLDEELVNSRSELAKRCGLSRPRVTQIMNLLDLAPEIRDHLLRLSDRKSVRRYSERSPRTLVQLRSHSAQVRQFSSLANRFGKESG
jgi:ParB-like chromosome segregation protein Spo0J